MRLLLSVLLAAVLGAACSSGPSVADVNAAANRLDASIGAYFGLNERWSDATDFTVEMLEQTRTALDRVQADFDTWSDLLDQADGANGPSARSYRNSLSAWLTVQHEQSALLGACVTDVGMDYDCFLATLRTHGARWQQASVELAGAYGR